MKLAPVFIGTLNRHKHFIRAVESLRANPLADETHLYVALDYPAKPEHYKGYERIKSFLTGISGFGDLSVIERESNFGAIRNFQDGKAKVLREHDRIIITEDDNCFSPNFLSYMNQGLDRFKTDKRIFAICGHNYPISLDGVYDGNYYAWRGCSVWGYGIWRDRYETMKYSRSDFVRQLRNPLKVAQAYRIAPHYVSSMLAKAMGKGEFDPFSDAAINLNLREKGQYCVFPTLSKVRNFGHDGSGLRSGAIKGESPFATQPVDNSATFDFDANEEHFLDNPAINKALFRYFYRGRGQTVKTIWRLLNFYLRGGGYSKLSKNTKDVQQQ